MASAMSTDFAAPYRHERSRVAVGAAPCEDIAVGGLNNREDVSGALVGHAD